MVRHIKEATTYIAHDPRKEEKEWGTASKHHDHSKVVEYALPDGNKIKVRDRPLLEAPYRLRKTAIY